MLSHLLEEKINSINSYTQYFTVLEKGKSLFDEKKYKDASIEFIKAILLHPEVIDGHFYMAQNFEALNLPDKALRSYNKVIDLCPSHATAIKNRAQLLQNPEEAKLDSLKSKVWQEFEKNSLHRLQTNILKYTSYMPSETQTSIISINYDFQPLLNATLALEEKNYALGITYYNRVLAECPDDFVTLSTIASAYYTMGDKTSAINYLNQSIQSSNFAVAFFTRGLIHYQSSDYLLAKADFIESIKWANAHEFETMTQGSNKNVVFKILTLNDNLQQDLTPIDLESGMVEIVKLINSKKYHDALKICQSLAHFNPQTFNYFLLGVVHFNLKDFESARFAFGLAIWLGFEPSLSYLYRGKINILLGFAGCAVADLKASLDSTCVGKKSEVEKEIVVDVISQVEKYYLALRLEQAEILLKAMLFEIRHPELYYKLGKTLLKQQKYIEAKTILDEGEAISKNQSQNSLSLQFSVLKEKLQTFSNNLVRDELISAETKTEKEDKTITLFEPYADLIKNGKKHLDEKNYQEAAVIFEQAIKLYSHLPDAFFYAGKVYGLQKETDKALRCYTTVLSICPKHVNAITERIQLNKFDKPADSLQDLQTRKESKLYADTYSHTISAQLVKYKRKEDISGNPLLSHIEKYDVESITLGSLAFFGGNHSVGLYFFDKAVKHYAEDFLSLTYRGLAYFKLRKNDKALHDFDKAIKLSAFSRAYFGRGFIHLMNHCDTLAKADFVNAIKNAGKADFEFYDLSYKSNIILDLVIKQDESILFTKDDLQDINKKIENCSTLNKSNIEPRNVLSNLNYLIARDPRSSSLYKSRATAHMRLKDLEASRLDLSLGIWVETNFSSLYDLYTTRCFINLKLEWVGAAIEDLRSAQRIVFTEGLNNLQDDFIDTTHQFTNSCLSYGEDEISNSDFEKALQYFSAPRVFAKHDEVMYKTVKTLIHLRKYNEAKAILVDEKEYIENCTKMEPKFASLKALIEKKLQPKITIEAPIVSPEPKENKKPKTKKTNNVSSNTPKHIHHKHMSHTLQIKEALNEPTKKEGILVEINNTKPVINEEKEQQRKDKNKAKAQKKRALKAKNKNQDQELPESSQNNDNLSKKPLEIVIKDPILPDVAILNLVPFVPNNIELMDIEKNIFQKIENFNKTHSKNYAYYVVGGSVFDRVLTKFYETLLEKREELEQQFSLTSIAAYLNQPLFNRVKKGIVVDDVDLVTELPIADIMELFKAMKPYRVEHVEGLVSINLGFIKIDIIHKESLSPLIKDAQQRDFAPLYLNKVGQVIDLDFGIYDLVRGILRSINACKNSFQIDPIRILRALYQSTKRDLIIHNAINHSMREQKNLLETLPAGQLNSYIKKLFGHYFALANFKKLWDYKLFSALFPENVCEAMNKNYGWLEQQAEQTPQYPRLCRIYAPYIVCTAINSWNGGYFNETILIAAEKIIIQSALFKEAFAKYNIADELKPVIENWKQCNIQAMQNTANNTSTSTLQRTFS